MKIEFRCSNCSALLNSSDELAGTAISCEKCKHQEIVPCLFAGLISEDNEAAWPKCPVLKHVKLYLTAFAYNLISFQAVLHPYRLKNRIYQDYREKLTAYLYETIFRNKLKKYFNESLEFIDKQNSSATVTKPERRQ
ncbi:MAG: hypothetical protein PHV82_02020 [Victivallaceae bacterium]|nr:hypothetical protein [Victivallaceae bacterium]